MEYNEVLDFWFGELKPEDWWRKGENLDLLDRGSISECKRRGSSVRAVPMETIRHRYHAQLGYALLKVRAPGLGPYLILSAALKKSSG